MIRHATHESLVDTKAILMEAKRRIEAFDLKSKVVQRQRNKAREANEKGLGYIWKRDVLEALGLPDIGYPVPRARLESLLQLEQLDYGELLNWLQVNSAEHLDEGFSSKRPCWG